MSTAQATLHDQIGSALQQSPYLVSKNLRFETHAGLVVLRGQVASYYQKQMAQEAVRRLDGVDQIENHLEVNWA